MKRVFCFIRRFAKGHRLVSRLVSVILTLLLIFYVVPPILYTKAAEAIGGEDETQESEPAGADIASSDPYGYESPVYEVKELREESVKHFRTEDGSYIAAQYGMPVHYLEDGRFEDINNTLQPVSGGFYATENSRIKFVKKTGGSGELFTLHDGSTKLTVSLVGAEKKTPGEIIEDESEEGSSELQKMMTLDGLTERIIYRDILDGVDIEYVLESMNVKENVIVKERREEYTYRFTLELNGLTARLADNGDILVSEGEDVKYTIPSPVVYDSAGAYAPRSEAWYTLVDLGNGKYSMAVTVTAEWMNAPDRAFPVTVDPTLWQENSDITGVLVTDTYVTSLYPNESNSNSGNLFVSNYYTSYWKTSILPTIPGNSYICEADVYFLSASTTASSENKVAAYKVTSSWNGNLTYNKYVAGEGAIDSTVLDYNSPSNIEYTPRYMKFNITSAVREWYNGSTNHGIALKALGSYTASISFLSYEYGGYPPFLTVAYVNMPGLESYWAYSSQSAGVGGTGNINLANGSLVLTVPTLSTQDNIMPFVPTLVYNSVLAGKRYAYPNALTAHSTSYMPRGFKLNIDQTIIKKQFIDYNNTAVEYYVYADGDGTEHAFYRSYSDNNVYLDEDGLNLKLSVDQDNEIVTITDDAKTTMTFESMSMADNDGVALAAWYLTEITDAAGNTLVFQFNSSLQPTTVCLRLAGTVYSVPMLELFYSNNRLVRIYDPIARRAAVLRYSDTYSNVTFSDTGSILRQIDFAYSTSPAAGWIPYTSASGSGNYISTYASARYYYFESGSLYQIYDMKANQRIDYTISEGQIITARHNAGSSNTPGQRVDYLYYSGYTRVTSMGNDAAIYTDDDVNTVYIFDKYGRTKSMYSYLGEGPELFGGTVGKYSDDEGAKNKLEEQTVLGGASANYVLNGDFEELDTTSVFKHWYLSGNASRTYGYSFSGEGNYVLRLSPSYGVSEASAIQYLHLREGKYTLSFRYLGRNCEGAELAVRIESLVNSGLDHVDYVSLHKTTAGGMVSTFSTTFDVPDWVGSGDRVKLTITARESSNSTYNPDVEIDRVMLESGIGNSEFNLVTYGGGKANGYTSSGQTIAMSEYWTHSDAGVSPTMVTSIAPFYEAIKLTGGIVSGDVSEEYVKQRIYEITAQELGYYDYERSSFVSNARFNYVVGGMSYAPDASYSPLSTYAICIDVIYYQGYGKEDVTVTHTFDFLPGVERWQYTGGSFSTKHEPDDPDDTSDYSCVKAIDVYCNYSNQPTGVAYFDNISVVGMKSTDTSRYEYYTEGENMGLPRAKKSFFYEEYYEYDSERRPSRVANNSGELTEYVYRANSNLIDYVVRYSFHSTTNVLNVSYPYLADDPDSMIVKTPLFKTVYTYNSYGQQTSVESYEVGADLTKKTGAKSIREEYTYMTDFGSNMAGVLLSYTDPDGNCLHYYYDDWNGNLVATINKAEGRGVIYEYSASGELEEVLEAEYDSQEDTYTQKSGGRSIWYRYSDEGQVNEIYDDIHAYRMSFDVFGNLTQVDAGYDVIAQYEYYPANGLLKKVTYGNGDGVEYSYNSLDLVEKVWYTESTGVRYLAYELEYTSTGQIHKIVDHESTMTTVYNYDSAGRITGFYHYASDTFLNEVWMNVSYDGRGYVLRETYSYAIASGLSIAQKTDVEYMYFRDDSGRLTDRDVDTLAIAGSEIYTYDVFDRLTGVSGVYTSDGSVFESVTSYTYDSTSDGSLTSGRVKTYSSQVGEGVALTYTYTYDVSGRITKIRYSTGEEIRYYYDNLGQLVREDNEPFGYTYIYEYDKGGNILRREECYIAAENATPVGIGEFTSTYEPMTGRMLTLDESITYDDYGNPLTYPFSRSFTWDGTRLASATDDGITANFKYNANGELTMKYGDVSTTYYYWSEGKLIAERVGALTYLYLYDAFGAPMGFQCRRSSDTVGEYEVYWFEKNLQGDIVAVYDNAGTKLISYVYDAWGNFEVQYHNGVNANHIAAKNPFRYRGYYYDSDLQLYYLKTRYYDPFACRFISPDRPDLLGANGDFNAYNLYAYCSNDPVNYVDPTGHSAILIGIIIGAVLGGIYGGVSAAANDQNILAGVLIGAVVGGLTSWITEAASVPVMLIGTFAFGAGGDIASQMILDGKSFGEVNLVSATLAGVTNVGLALVGRGLSKVDSMNDLMGLDKILYGTMTNSPLLALGMAINMGISKHAPVYTIEDLYNDTIGKYKELKWRW